MKPEPYPNCCDGDVRLQFAMIVASMLADVFMISGTREAKVLIRDAVRKDGAKAIRVDSVRPRHCAGTLLIINYHKMGYCFSSSHAAFSRIPYCSTWVLLLSSSFLLIIPSGQIKESAELFFSPTFA